jgi:hypothetical protein
MKKNPVLFWLVLVFILVNVLDLITTFFILPGEANPIVLLTKTPLSLLLIKVGLIIGIYLIYRKNIYPTRITYFGFLLTLVLGTAAMGLAVYGNILGMMNPEIVQQAAALSTGEKVKGYSQFITIFYLIPIAMSMIAFWLYDKSLSTIELKKEEFRWWWKK